MMFFIRLDLIVGMFETFNFCINKKLGKHLKVFTGNLFEVMKMIYYF